MHIIYLFYSYILRTKRAQTFAIRLLGHHNHHTYMGMPAP